MFTIEKLRIFTHFKSIYDNYSMEKTGQLCKNYFSFKQIRETFFEERINLISRNFEIKLASS